MTEHEPQPDDAGTLNRFLQAYLADRKAGAPRPLEDYQKRWPHAKELIAREYDRVSRGDAEEAEQAARRVGPFDLTRELGRGGQGVVYLARDRRLNRLVALKVLGGMAALQRDQLDRFRREAAIAARLDHPGVCSVHEAGETDGTAWIAMQYVEGTSLAEIIKEERARRAEAGSAVRDHPSGVGSVTREGIRSVVKLMVRVGQVLEDAHAAGVIHRDVKPGNIMVRADGDVVLLDFGLALEMGSVSAGLTVSGGRPGTLPYMAPERLAEKPHADHRADVWSLGVTLYECLTLRRPFEGITERVMMDQIIDSEPQSLRKLSPIVPSPLELIVVRALEKDPTRRYASAGALATDLEAFLEGRPLEVRPPGPWSRTAVWLRRHRLATGAGALAAGVAAAVAAAIFLVQASQARADRRGEARAALVTARRTIADEVVPVILLPDVVRAVSLLEADDPGLGIAVDTAEDLISRGEHATAEMIALRVLQHQPGSDLAARAHLVILESRLFHLDPAGARVHLGAAEMVGRHGSRVASARAAVEIMGNVHAIEMPSQLLCRIPGRSGRPDELIFQDGKDTAQKIILHHWSLDQGKPRDIPLPLPDELTAQHGPFRVTCLSTIAGEDEPHELLIGVEHVESHDSWVLRAALREPYAPLSVAMSGFRDAIKTILVCDRDRDRASVVAVVSGGGRTLSVRNGMMGEALTMPSLSAEGDDDIFGLQAWKRDGHEDFELLFVSPGHHAFGLFSFDITGGGWKALLPKEDKHPLTDLGVLGGSWLGTSSFRPSRADFPARPDVPVGIHVLGSENGDFKLGRLIWRVPAGHGPWAGPRSLAIAGGDRPFFATRLTWGGLHEHQTLFLIPYPLEWLTAAASLVGTDGRDPAGALLRGYSIGSDVTIAFTANLDGDEDKEIVLQTHDGLRILGLNEDLGSTPTATEADVEGILRPLVDPVANRDWESIRVAGPGVLARLVGAARIELLDDVISRWLEPLAPTRGKDREWLAACRRYLDLLNGHTLTRPPGSPPAAQEILNVDSALILELERRCLDDVLLRRDFQVRFDALPGGLGPGAHLRADPAGHQGGRFGRGSFAEFSTRLGAMKGREPHEVLALGTSWQGQAAFRLRLEFLLHRLDLGGGFEVKLIRDGNEGDPTVSVNLTHGRDSQRYGGDRFHGQVTAVGIKGTPWREEVPLGQWLQMELVYTPELSLIRFEMRKIDRSPELPPLCRTFLHLAPAAEGRHCLLFSLTPPSSPEGAGSIPPEVTVYLDQITFDHY